MKAGICTVAAGAALAAALLLTLSGPEPALAAAGCNKPKRPPSIEVNITEPEVEFDRSLSKPELTSLAVQEYGYVHAEKSAVFGLTTGRIRSRLSIHTLAEKRKDGVYCVWPARVIAIVDYEGPILVHVAREHPKGSCQYKAVLDHEMEHVAVFKKALRDYEKRLKKALERALARGKFPVTDRDHEAAGAELSAHFEVAFKDAVLEADEERDRRNALVDTPESYERTRKRCSSW